MAKCLLVLDDGSIFEGKSFGKKGTTLGEICFNTGMTGYQEIFTDPSYYGQIVVMNNAHIGNYGTITDEAESTGIKLSGLICRNFSNYNSRNQSTSLADFFKKTVGIYDIDTRTLVSHIRQRGSQNCIISSETFDIEKLQELLSNHPKMTGRNLHHFVTAPKNYSIGKGKYKIGILDLGLKTSILKNLLEYDYTITVFPSNTDFTTIESFDFDGFFISNGPGDPGAMQDVLNTVKSIINSNKPVFGICMGHQLIGLANGITTFKMLNGHRGCNHPVIDLGTGKSEITSQNHGFCLSEVDIQTNTDIEITHRHLNDNTIMGIEMKSKPVFSVQYHPEAGPGPNDSKYLFSKFFNLIQQYATK